MAAVGEVAFEVAEMRRREFRRILVASLVAHVLLFAVLAWTPQSGRTATLPPGALTVDLVAAPERVASRKPKPAAPAPVKPKPPPPPKKVVLPKDPAPVKKPTKKPVAPPEVAPEPEPVEERDLTDILADLRSEAGEETETPSSAATPAPAPGSPSPTGVVVSPEVAAWVRATKIHVRRSWVLPPGFRTQALEAHVSVELDASGNVIGEPHVTKRSGNPWYDEGVTRAVRKASPLPAPPEAGRWPFIFIPQDSY